MPTVPRAGVDGDGGVASPIFASNAIGGEWYQSEWYAVGDVQLSEVKGARKTCFLAKGGWRE